VPTFKWGFVRSNLLFAILKTPIKEHARVWFYVCTSLLDHPARVHGGMTSQTRK
jgi:hypothetical protein